MVNCINLIIEMSPRFVLGRENLPCVAEVVNRSLKADCTDFTCLATSTERSVTFIKQKTKCYIVSSDFHFQFIESFSLELRMLHDTGMIHSLYIHDAF